MDPDLEKFVREQKDRSEIHDCIMTYCRGIDRLDRALLESVYHSDALDDHGVFVGPASKFIDWVLEFHATYQKRTMHLITTHRCELDGNIAHTESYYTYRALNKTPPFYNYVNGRYLDRFEKRQGRWAIAERICTVDISDEFLVPDGAEAHPPLLNGVRDETDLSYRRPLRIDRSRFTV
jgi:hypothetical protein